MKFSLYEIYIIYIYMCKCERHLVCMWVNIVCAVGHIVALCVYLCVHTCTHITYNDAYRSSFWLISFANLMLPLSNYVEFVWKKKKMKMHCDPKLFMNNNWKYMVCVCVYIFSNANNEKCCRDKYASSALLRSFFIYE